MISAKVEFSFVPPKIRILESVKKKLKEKKILKLPPFYDADPQVDSGKSDRPYLRIEEE